MVTPSCPGRMRQVGEQLYLLDQLVPGFQLSLPGRIKLSIRSLVVFGPAGDCLRSQQVPHPGELELDNLVGFGPECRYPLNEPPNADADEAYEVPSQLPGLPGLLLHSPCDFRRVEFRPVIPPRVHGVVATVPVDERFRVHHTAGSAGLGDAAVAEPPRLPNAVAIPSNGRPWPSSATRTSPTGDGHFSVHGLKYAVNFRVDVDPPRCMPSVLRTVLTISAIRLSLSKHATRPGYPLIGIWHARAC